MTQPTPKVNWHVASQSPGMGRLPGGPYVQGVNVAFGTDSGLSGTVFVPQDQYNVETVQAAVSAAVQRMVAVHRLTGSA